MTLPGGRGGTKKYPVYAARDDNEPKGQNANLQGPVYKRQHTRLPASAAQNDYGRAAQNNFGQAVQEEAGDSWEDLWRLYHRSVSNESRKNLKLQRQFMPARYQKYLCEFGPVSKPPDCNFSV
jgi:hypothetical protein